MLQEAGKPAGGPVDLTVGPTTRGSPVASLFAAVTRAMGALSAGLVAAMLVIICYDVLARYAFNAPTTWATEVSTYALAGIAFLGLGYAYGQGAHVRVELLLARLPEAFRRRLLLAGAWLGLWYVTVFLWQAVILVVNNHAYGTRSYGLFNTPVYVPQMVMIAGLAGLALAVIAEVSASSGAVSRQRMSLVAAVVAAAAAALVWMGVRPPMIEATSIDWGSVVIFAAWLGAVSLWSGGRVALLAALPLGALAVLMMLAQGAGLGGVLGALALSIVIMLGLGLPVAIALGMVGLAGIYLLIPIPSLMTLAERGWSSMGSFTLTAIPMFVLMGSALLRSGISTDLFDAFTKWLGRMPGGIAHAGIGACSIFSAVSGSSLATASTVGMVACPEMTRRDYDPRLNYGSIAAGGTLGILIPPSIAMIIYASIVGVPVTKMFMAGIVPGILLTVAFMALVFVWALIKPGAAPRPSEQVSWSEKLGAARAITPVVLLIGGVLGALYAGVATPTEAAAVGAFGAFILCGVRGRLNRETVMLTLFDTAKVTSFLLFIVIGASILSYLFDFVRLATELVQAVHVAGLTPWMTLAIICLLYLGLGMFLDPISMMVMTLPVVYPLLVAFGFDPIWFGIVLVILIEIGLITPPVGMNLYVLQGVNPGAKTREIMLGALPFILVMLLVLGALIAVPEIALWLPGIMD